MSLSPKQTFLEWVFDIHRPPAQIIQVPLTPLKAIENELTRIHGELNSFTSTGGSYDLLVQQLDKLNNELIRRSQAEDKNV